MHALVLRRRDAGESDRRLTLLTRELGVLDVVAKGARKAGSRLAGSSEPMMACIFGIAPGKKQRFVTQAQPISAFPGLRADYDRLTYGLALCELAAEVLHSGEPMEESFQCMVAALSFLEIHENPLVCLIWAQTALMRIAGFRPEFLRCAVTGQPVAEDPAWVSPHAGGYVSMEAAGRYRDREAFPAEVLYGAAKIAELERPPAKLKHARETYLMLFEFWKAMAHSDLPAGRQVAEKLREHKRNGE